MEFFFAVCADGAKKHHVHLPTRKVKGLRLTHEALVSRASRVLKRRVIRVVRCEIDDDLLFTALTRLMDVALVSHLEYEKRGHKPKE